MRLGYFFQVLQGLDVGVEALVDVGVPLQVVVDDLEGLDFTDSTGGHGGEDTTELYNRSREKEKFLRPLSSTVVFSLKEYLVMRTTSLQLFRCRHRAHSLPLRLVIVHTSPTTATTQ